MKVKRVKGRAIPRSLVKKLTEDIGLFMDNAPYGWLQALEMFEQVPLEVRENLLEEMSACHSQAVLDFFSLLKTEYGRDLEEILERLTRKFAMAGLTPRPPAEPPEFYGAYACCSRHSGQICLDVAWRSGKGKVKVDSLLLSFHGDGLCSVLPMEQLVTRFTRDRAALRDMLPLSLEESCSLIKDAWRCNQRFVSRPALGRFLYQKYLDYPETLSAEDKRRLLRRLTGSLTPRQLVNSLFHALRYQDEAYIDVLLTRDYNWSYCPNLRPDQHASGFLTLLEGRVESAQGTAEQMEIAACTLNLRGERLYRCYYRCSLVCKDGQWLIREIRETAHEYIDDQHADNPLNTLVHCQVFTILDVDRLFNLLDELENVREMEELPLGVHLRIEDNQNDFNVGVSYMSGVVADLVVNGDEFVVIFPDAEAAEALKDFIPEGEPALRLYGEYEVNLSAVYEYLSGRYVYFEELFSAAEEANLFEDGLCLISTRYLMRDRSAVQQRLRELGCVLMLDQAQEEFQVYYQFDQRADQNAILAEYILWNSWMTLSAFGDSDLQKIRCAFEDNMFAAIEFDGVEIREDGIFDILNDDVCREHPELVQRLKEVYLNKWYVSRLGVLSGMSPSEARQTEEGTRMLWAMFQQIRQREKRASLNGELSYLELKDYMRRADIQK